MKLVLNLRRRYVCAGFASIALLGCAPDNVKFHATDITGAPFAKSLALDDHTGRPRTLADFKGKLVLVSFGFTHCPDYCPATLSIWAQTLKNLGATDAAKVQALFVTVDPERDTQDLLKQYVPAFDPSFLGMRGTLEQTKTAAAEFKVVYQKATGATPATYTVDHSTQTYVFDRNGNVRLMVAHGTEPAKLAADLKLLLK